MRKLLFLIIALWSAGSMASECYPGYSEKDLISATGEKPVKRSIEKEDGIVRHQYEFIKEATKDELMDEKIRDNYVPQFYITIYNPTCPNKVKLWFFGDDAGVRDGKIDIAAKAWSYLTGSESTIFKNKLSKFSGVQKFESYDEKANSLFMKAGGMYIVDVHLK